MKKTLLAVVLALLMVVALGLTACQQTVTLTLYDTDGTTVLDTVTVKSGEAPAKPQDPTKAGHTFEGWFVTPTNQTEFDFTKPLTKDAKAYAQWIDNTYEDGRIWVIVGNGTFSWEEAVSGSRFTKKSGTNNVFELTTDLYKDNEFQLTVLLEDGGLAYKNGGARACGSNLRNAGEYMEAKGNGLDSAANTNILVTKDGNYTLTLITAEDNAKNRITVKRNGDATPPDEKVTISYHIKGNGITYWADALTPATTFKENTAGKMELTVYLKQNEEFMFTKMSTKGDTHKQETTYNATNLTETSKTLFEGTSNLKAKEAGYYTFILDVDKKEISATLDKETARIEMNYFIDGTILGGTYGDYMKADKQAQYKMTKNGDIYSIEGVQLNKDEELIIRSHPATEKDLTWSTPRTDYGVKYLFGTTGFVAANNNIKVEESGKYNIIFDSYTQFVTVAKEGKDIYIKGSMQTNWSHGFKSEYKFSATDNKNVYELTITLAVDNEFGLETYFVGSKVGGVWVGLSDKLGTAGDANGSFSTTLSNGDASHNLVCNQAGTYKLSYNLETGKLDIYAVTEPAA